MSTRLRGLLAALCAGAIAVVLALVPLTSTGSAQAAGSFVKGINLNGGAVTVEGNSWLSQSTAAGAGFSTTAAKTFTNSITWSPSADVGTSQMLNSVIYQSAASFSMSQTISNGQYDVYFWLTENYANNARSENIKLEGATVASGVGSMAKNTWVKSGPYTTTVNDGTLNIDFSRITGDPQVAGLAIFTSGTTTSPTPTATTIPGLGGLKPRVINATDLGADPDDLESLVRMLVTANEVDLEGLIAVTSCWQPTQTADNMSRLLTPRLNAYAQVLPNLQKQAAGYPSLAYLQSISKLGQTEYGMGGVGTGKDSPGSDLIIAAADKNDPRPVWINLWGGGNTVAQALWKVESTRTASQVEQFVSKLRIYDVLGQDDAGAWITKNFPHLIYLRAKNMVYGWQPSDAWVDSNVQSRGLLGAQYPEKAYSYEGDTPSLLYEMPNGLTDPEHVDWGGWGGRFDPTKMAGVRGMTESGRLGTESSSDPYYMYTDAPEGESSIARWSTAFENDFAARMLWTVTSSYGGANHNPIAVLNSDKTKQIMQVSVSAGSIVSVTGAGSSDPDGNTLSYSWLFYDEPSSYNGTVKIQDNTSISASVQVPSDAAGKSLHIILTVNDNGTPNLYSYRRLIINVR